MKEENGRACIQVFIDELIRNRVMIMNSILNRI